LGTLKNGGSMIIGFNGNPRTGKTLAVTFFVLLMAYSGKQCYGNYRINHPNCHLIDIYDLIVMMKAGRDNPNNSPLHNAVFYGTEIYGWLESRLSSTSHTGLLVTYFIFQSGKLGFDIIHDAQLIGTVDLRLRELTEIRFESEKTGEGFTYWLLEPSIKDENVRTGKKFLLPNEVAALFWNSYKSWEIIEPLQMDSLFFEMEKLSPARLNRAVNRQVQLLKASGYRGAKTKMAVENALLQLEEPLCFASYVACRL
jgi:hypothetical protein